ncbi:MAG: hypothetical protein KC636_37275, partial [Myxococcales bacterium]|nr:hypothetical protein [Myxococcales bacterium]
DFIHGLLEGGNADPDALSTDGRHALVIPRRCRDLVDPVDGRLARRALQGSIAPVAGGRGRQATRARLAR